MQNQRIRNLTTEIIHTSISDVYQDIGYFIGAGVISTAQIPLAVIAIRPYLKKFVRDAVFWNGEHDLLQSGETNIPPMHSLEIAKFWQRMEEIRDGGAASP